MRRCLLPLILAAALSSSPPAFAQTKGAGPEGKTAAGGEVVREGLGRQLDEYLNGLAAGGFSGAVMVVRNKRLVLLKGYGTADRGRKLPVTHRTLLQLGSVTKQLTGAAVLKLEMEGKLRVTDSITKYFEDVPPDKRPITIHQLLTHTSGLPERVTSCSSKVANLGRDEYVRQVLAAELKSAPGEVHLYSNDGYGLLAALVEVASGEPFEQYLRRHLFAPAGMTSTGYNFGETELARAARGYRGAEEFMGNLNPTFRNASGPAWCSRGSGGIVTSAEDMYRWYRALGGTRVLSARAKEKLFHPHVPESPERTSFYGYGWALFKTTRGTRLIAHDGSLSDYFTSDFRMYVDEGVAFFVAANTTEHTAMDAAGGMARVIFPAPPNKTGR